MNEDTSYSIHKGIVFNVRKGDSTMTEIEKLEIKVKTLNSTVKSIKLLYEDLKRENKLLIEENSRLINTLTADDENHDLASYVKELEQENRLLNLEIATLRIEEDDLK